ncbi:MAG TPA: hypothetical protein DCG24_02390 [Bacteroidetes bacterium]|nr:hypothetical protein [Bacteroidota bacterium]
MRYSFCVLRYGLLVISFWLLVIGCLLLDDGPYLTCGLFIIANPDSYRDQPPTANRQPPTTDC